jgi:hypothetical protein
VNLCITCLGELMPTTDIAEMNHLAARLKQRIPEGDHQEYIMRSLKCGLAAAFVLAISVAALGYGDEGHTMVGAIADARLANDNDPAAAATRTRIHDLIGSMSLADAAILPDKIKDWISSMRTPRQAH